MAHHNLIGFVGLTVHRLRDDNALWIMDALLADDQQIMPGDTISIDLQHSGRHLFQIQTVERGDVRWVALMRPVDQVSERDDLKLLRSAAQAVLGGILRGEYPAGGTKMYVVEAAAIDRLKYALEQSLGD